MDQSQNTSIDDKGAGQTNDKSSTPAAEKSHKARVLRKCELGEPNDVVVLLTSDLKAAEKEGLVDSSKAAVSYAESLQKSQEE